MAGLLYESLGELEASRGHLELAVTLQPSNADAQRVLAKVLDGVGEPVAADVHRRAYLALAPGAADAGEEQAKLLRPMP